MGYAPLDNDFLMSSTFRLGPLHTAVWSAILSSKDQDGFTALKPEFLAAIWHNKGGADLESIRSVWDDLARPDSESSNREHEGRRIIPTPDGRWLVVSHVKYREKHMKERRREIVRESQRRSRARAKQSGSYLACSCGQPATSNDNPGGDVYCDACLPKEPPDEYMKKEDQS